MKKITLFLIIVVIALLTLNIFLLIPSITGQTVKQIPENNDFKVYTKAICDENTNNIECQDNIFVKCGNVDTKLGNLIGSNVKFELDWEDPRN